MATHPLTIVWLTNCLRVEDNPALHAACERGPVIPIFIYSPEEEGNWPPGEASRWWLHHSLESLSSTLNQMGLPLIIRQGNTLNILKQLIIESKADAVFWNRRYEPFAIENQALIKRELHNINIKSQSFNSSLLFEPWTVANKQGKPFQVFTPFWKTCLEMNHKQTPLPIPTVNFKLKLTINSEQIGNLKLLPKVNWDIGLKKQWKAGTNEAKIKLSSFIKNSISSYSIMRDRPDTEGVSLLSPYLHFGEISPRMIWSSVLDNFSLNDPIATAYLRQLGWREFAHHLLFHFPNTPDFPLRSHFASFPWKKNSEYLKAWQKGLTGYPIVDAGMRQLWQTGWMHNRVRMVVGSFLVKDLLISWTEGARWFWETLVDADLANNTLGWQWVGGCGADAAPYFRIFNPITQGEKFDPNGEYVKKWIPELTQLPTKWIHQPWNAPKSVLENASVILGKTYPFPIVDHAIARVEALNAFSSIRDIPRLV
ncbi:MAG: deoxyribodipyrimidine photo-lyase [Parachlamydiaceae bacterium]|nr:deoxyribodipyrimidine photo-lyase [Parachlamydiaceae bacterium]